MEKQAQKIDAAIWLALLCVLVGWFCVDTLTMNAGVFRNGFRFFQVPVIIAHPSTLFIGSRDATSAALLPFTAVCCLALLAPLAPRCCNVRAAWLAMSAPLALMTACAVTLYWSTSADIFHAAAGSDPIYHDLLRLATDVLNRGGSLAARRVSVAAGGYLATLGSFYLALRGLHQYRTSGASVSAAGDAPP